MNRIEIKLKECCLICEDLDPRGVIGFGICALDDKREIACGHMKVCYKYRQQDQADKDVDAGDIPLNNLPEAGE